MDLPDVRTLSLKAIKKIFDQNIDDLPNFPWGELTDKNWSEIIGATKLIIADDNGNLIWNGVSGGYLRTKTTLERPRKTLVAAATSDDTPMAPSGINYPNGFQIMGLYQDSGGPLDFTVMDQTGTVIIFTQTGIASGTWTPFDHPNFRFGYSTMVKWSAAAGAGQKAYIQEYGEEQVDQDGV